MIYIVIPEPFSATEGVALAKIAADVLRYQTNTVVVCPSADLSWGFPSERILAFKGLSDFRQIRGWRFVPMGLRRALVLPMFSVLLQRLDSRDVVWFLNWWELAEPISEAIRKTGAKCVYHLQNSHKDLASRGLFQRLKPDAVVCLSDFIRHEIEAFLPRSLSVCTIYNGCDLLRFWPNDQGANNHPRVVLFVGRLIPSKGIDVLISAVNILNERGVAIRCRVIGSSHAQAAGMKPNAYTRGLRELAPANIEFVGFRDGTVIAEDYRASDILCCPSVWDEPFGLVNVEAMACGLPVVASRTGGIPEIASFGGIHLFERGDATDLAEKLQELIENDTLRDKLRIEGIAAVNGAFTAQITTSKYMELANQLLASSGDRS